MESLWQDLRFGVRLAVARPGFTAVAVLALALGIGPNTAIFSIVNTLLLTPPPYADPGSVVTTPATQQNASGRLQTAVLTSNDVQDWRQETRTLQQIAMYRQEALTLTGRGEARRVTSVAVSPGLFTLLGVVPLRGRFLEPAEENPAAAPVVVLSHRAWQRTFESDPDIVGKVVQLGDIGRQVVGVMPESFRFPDRETEYWTPLPLSADSRRVSVVPFIARLKPGVTIVHAEAEGRAIVERNHANLTVPGLDPRLPFRLVPLQERLTGSVRPALLVVSVAVGLVLLIACANVASLLLSRTATRQRELAVRATLGAGRARLVRQLLTEGAVLAVLGGTVGVLLAFWMLTVLGRLAPPELLAAGVPGIDRATLAFGALVSLLTSALFGLTPALAVARASFVTALKQGSRHDGGGRLLGRNWARSGLTVAQVALALMLLVGAGLLMRSLRLLLEQDPGYRPAGAIAAQINLPPQRYATPVSRIAFFDQLLAATRRHPGVQAAGITTSMPMTRARMLLQFRVVGGGDGPGTSPQGVGVRLVSPGFVPAMGTRLLGGRDFLNEDREKTEPVVIVNAAFASRHLAGRNVVGTSLDMGGSRRIVGVVESMKPQGLDSDPVPEVFLPYTQFPELLMLDAPAASLTLVTRTTGDPLAQVPAIRSAVATLDRQLPVYGIATLEQRLSESVSRPRFFATLLGIFAGFALTLAAVGLYGVLASQVAQSTREIGIEMALGAAPARIRRRVVGHAVALTAAGVVLGLAGAWGLTRFMTSVLFAIRPLDPVTYFVATLALFAAASVGACLPALRATAVDPVTAIRGD